MRVMTRLRDEVTISVDDAVTTVLGAQYVRWYDSLPSGATNQIDVLDLALPAFLDAVPSFKALLADLGWDALRSKLDKASEILERVPDDVDLASFEDTDHNRALLKWLFQACTGGKNNGFPEFGPARATKLLHKKRPLLLPIIDSWQLEAWHRRSDPWSTDDMVDVVFFIRGQVVRWQDDLHQVRTRLEAEDPTLPVLSDVRLYDIIFWETSRPS